jgi:CHAD domain-containing protein
MLDAPAQSAGRVIASGLLDDVVARFGALDTEKNGEALHDFRVALRHLRSWLRALPEDDAAPLPRKAVRRLRRIASVSNESRDAEVQAIWLRAQRRWLSVHQRVGLDWLLERLDANKAEADARLRRRLTRDFERSQLALSAALKETDASAVDLASADEAPDKQPTTLGSSLASSLREQAATLRRRLRQVRSAADTAAAHRARVAGKRVRYLLEPFKGDVPEADAAVRALRELQDSLGELHDAHVLFEELLDALGDAADEHVERLRSAAHDDADQPDRLEEERHRSAEQGIVALVARLRARQAAAFNVAAGRWLGDGTEPLLATLAEAFDRIAAAPREERGAEIPLKLHRA